MLTRASDWTVIEPNTEHERYRSSAARLVQSYGTRRRQARRMILFDVIFVCRWIMSRRCVNRNTAPSLKENEFRGEKRLSRLSQRAEKRHVEVMVTASTVPRIVSPQLQYQLAPRGVVERRKRAKAHHFPRMHCHDYHSRRRHLYCSLSSVLYILAGS